MAHRKTLNQKQIELLQWIDEGCTGDGPGEGYAYRVSAAALRSRGLVKVTGKGSRWAATITDAGRKYLNQAETAEAQAPREPNISVTQALVDQVISAGGRKRYPRKAYYEKGVDYARRAELAH